LNHVQAPPAWQRQPRSVLQRRQMPEGIDCDNEPGIIIHDDGGIENGYSGAPGRVTEVRFVDKFTPSSYPASFSSMCLDFVILAGGPGTYPVDLVVYDDDGADGSPGDLLGEINGVTASTHLFSGGGQAPVWNSYDISSMGLNITSGSVYIGTRYVPPANNVFTSADESGPVGFAGGYWWNNFDGVWSQTQNAFPGYTSMFIRAVESGGGGGSPTPTPTGTPGGCQFHVLIAYADSPAVPTQLQSQILAEPNVIAVDLFDATTGTPTLGQLQAYEIVVPFSNSPF